MDEGVVDERLKVRGDKVAGLVEWRERGVDVGWWADRVTSRKRCFEGSVVGGVQERRQTTQDLFVTVEVRCAI